MMRLPTISRSDGKLSFEVVLVCSAMLLLLFCFPQIVIQPVVAVVPEAAVGLEPVVELAKRLWPQVVDALLGNRTDLDHTGVAEHPKVLGDLRLVEVELAGDFSYRSRSLAQELDDEEAIWFGEGSKRVHLPKYTSTGICLSRNIFDGPPRAPSASAAASPVVPIRPI